MKTSTRLGLSAAAALLSGLAPLGAQAVSSGGSPLPLELAFSAKSVRGWDHPAVSADGKWIAYEIYSPPEVSPEVAMPEGTRILPSGTPPHAVGLRTYLSPTAGGQPREICPAAGNCWRPSFSPDGTKIAFYSDADGYPQPWVWESATGKSKRVAEGWIKAKHWPGDEASWSPDGREIFVPLNPAGRPPASPDAATGAPGAEKAPVVLKEPTVKVFKTGGEAEPDPGAPGMTPAAMMEHFIRENNATLAAIDIATGKTRVVVPADAEPRPSCLRLSPDGKWVSYLSVFKMKGETASEVYYDLAVAPVSGGKPVVVAADVDVPEGVYFEDTYRWTPGSKSIVFLKGKKLWLADAAAFSKAPRPLAAALGDLEEAPLLLTRDGSAVLVGIAAEGEKIYYSVPPRALALVPLDGGAPKTIATVGVPIAANRDSLWQTAGGGFAVVANDDDTGERSVVSVDPATGAGTVLWKGRGRFEAAGAAAGGGVVASFEALEVPPDFYLFDPKFASKTRISHAEPRLDAVRVGPMAMFESQVPGFDGRLQSVLSAVFLPPGKKKGDRLPAVVYFYAGSRMSTTAQQYGGGAPNSIPVQVFASRGYAVLLVDVPLGPQGKGGNPIQEMGDAVLAQVYRAANEGYLDIERVAIMGQSYGGYGTAALITQTNLFRAAMALNGLYDLSGDYARMKGGTSFNFVWSETGQGRMGSHPWGELRRYLANSPYYQADKIHTPLLLIHGRKDDTCPVEGAEKMFNALKRLERTAQLAIYDGEGHVPGSFSIVNAVDATQRMVDFLAKYVAPGTEGRAAPAASSGSTK